LVTNSILFPITQKPICRGKTELTLTHVAGSETFDTEHYDVQDKVKLEPQMNLKKLFAKLG